MAEGPTNACAVCKKEEEEGVKLQTCARCKNRSYCGKECQTKDWETHKRHCMRQNYVLKVHLHPNEIVNPPIFRTLSCPADATFEDFHQALQIAFNWAGTHTYDFKVKDPVAEAERAAEEDGMTEEEAMVKFILRTTGKAVHGVPNLLRILEDEPFGPGGYAPGCKGIDFMHNEQRTHPRTPEKKSSTVKLYEVLEKKRYKGMPLEYEYDFGDSWEHDITLVGRKEATDFFVCIDGEGHYAAEDVGSCRGWNKLKAAYRTTRPDAEQRDQMKWFEQTASNRDAQGLRNGREGTWAKGKINSRLAELAGKAFSFT